MRSKHIQKIISAPHETLRKVATPISLVDTKLLQLVRSVETTLQATSNPKGVGLAAPQIDVSKRVFSTQLEEILSFINPAIVTHSKEQVLGTPDEETRLEGCLSIPGVYGPVPRWQWVELEFQVLAEKELITRRERFTDFTARVIQHELDHLNGILFIDYSLTYDLPVYTDDSQGEKLIPLEESVLIALGARKLSQ